MLVICTLENHINRDLNKQLLIYYFAFSYFIEQKLTFSDRRVLLENVCATRWCCLFEMEIRVCVLPPEPPLLSNKLVCV